MTDRPMITHTRAQANSIEGCKLKEVPVVYTRWRNLKKTKSMEVGGWAIASIS